MSDDNDESLSAGWLFRACDCAPDTSARGFKSVVMRYSVKRPDPRRKPSALQFFIRCGTPRHQLPPGGGGRGSVRGGGAADQHVWRLQPGRVHRWTAVRMGQLRIPAAGLGQRVLSDQFSLTSSGRLLKAGSGSMWRHTGGHSQRERGSSLHVTL